MKHYLPDMELSNARLRPVLKTPDVAPSSKLRKAMSGKPGAFVRQAGNAENGSLVGRGSCTAQNAKQGVLRLLPFRELCLTAAEPRSVMCHRALHFPSHSRPRELAKRGDTALREITRKTRGSAVFRHRTVKGLSHTYNPCSTLSVVQEPRPTTYPVHGALSAFPPF